MSSDYDVPRVNRFVLKKQKLTGEKPNQNIVETVRSVGGLHATGAATPYLSLFARVKDFRREDLDRELARARNSIPNPTASSPLHTRARETERAHYIKTARPNS